MTSRKILFGSVLKAVNDPRMYHRMGHTAAAAGYKILIAGTGSNEKSLNKKITFCPIHSGSRSVPKRIAASVRFFRICLREHPDIIVAGTHELLFASVLFSFLNRKTKVVYDIRENYFMNIIHQNIYPGLLKYILAFYIRCKELLLSLAIDQFWLAERCYKDQLPFIRKERSYIIENKYAVPAGLDVQNTKEEQSFSFTGTIGPPYGPDRAIEFARKVNEAGKAYTLRITGYSPSEAYFKKITRLASHTPGVVLHGGNKFIPHRDIIRAECSSAFALLPYRILKSNKKRIPSKIYELLYHRVPMIIQKNPYWEKILQPYDCASFIDFSSVTKEEINTALKRKYYQKSFSKEQFLWSTEEKVLLSSLSRL